MSIYVERFALYCSERIYMRLRRAILLAAIKSSPNYLRLRKDKRKHLQKRIRKYLTFRGLSVIIMTSVLTGCGLMKSSSPSTLSCVDMTTYVNNAKTAAQVISRERLCEMARTGQ